MSKRTSGLGDPLRIRGTAAAVDVALAPLTVDDVRRAQSGKTALRTVWKKWSLSSGDNFVCVKVRALRCATPKKAKQPKCTAILTTSNGQTLTWATAPRTAFFAAADGNPVFRSDGDVRAHIIR